MLQLVSPALPVGGFSYSEGLEWQIQKEKIINESTLFEWLKAELLRGQIRLEASAQSFIRDALENWHRTNENNAVENEEDLDLTQFDDGNFLEYLKKRPSLDSKRATL